MFSGARRLTCHVAVLAHPFNGIALTRELFVVGVCERGGGGGEVQFNEVDEAPGFDQPLFEILAG
jgi:hypothetical protein